LLYQYIGVIVVDRYVHPTEQLVTEIVVRDMRRSVGFYLSLGFDVLRDDGDFVELTWEDHRLFLAELSAYHEVHGAELPDPRSEFPLANLRVMVSNVDDYWRLTNRIGERVVVPIADRYTVCETLSSWTRTGSASASRARCRRVRGGP
jgi:catechol 2,3-dioxygenase-like lactoylglutathione lyase family enzyme